MIPVGNPRQGMPRPPLNDSLHCSTFVDAQPMVVESSSGNPYIRRCERPRGKPVQRPFGEVRRRHWWVTRAFARAPQS
jgi:hypothetical protein